MADDHHDDDAAAVAKRIRAARGARKLAQVELARVADIDPVTMYRIENGVHKPRASTLDKLATALKVDVHWLLHGGSDGPVADPALSHERKGLRTVESDEVPFVVAALCGSQRLGVVCTNELLYLADLARKEPGYGMDELELALLNQRVMLARDEPEVRAAAQRAWNAALDRQSRERHEHPHPLNNPPPTIAAPTIAAPRPHKVTPSKSHR